MASAASSSKLTAGPAWLPKNSRNSSSHSSSSVRKTPVIQQIREASTLNEFQQILSAKHGLLRVVHLRAAWKQLVGLLHAQDPMEASHTSAATAALDASLTATASWTSTSNGASSSNGSTAATAAQVRGAAAAAAAAAEAQAGAAAATEAQGGGAVAAAGAANATNASTFRPVTAAAAAAVAYNLLQHLTASKAANCSPQQIKHFISTSYDARVLLLPVLGPSQPYLHYKIETEGQKSRSPLEELLQALAKQGGAGPDGAVHGSLLIKLLNRSSSWQEVELLVRYSQHHLSAEAVAAALSKLVQLQQQKRKHHQQQQQQREGGKQQQQRTWLSQQQQEEDEQQETVGSKSARQSHHQQQEEEEGQQQRQEDEEREHEVLGQLLYQRLVQSAEQHATAKHARELSTILWAVAKLGVKPSQQWVLTMAARVLEGGLDFGGPAALGALTGLGYVQGLVEEQERGFRKEGLGEEGKGVVLQPKQHGGQGLSWQDQQQQQLQEGEAHVALKKEPGLRKGGLGQEGSGVVLQPKQQGRQEAKGQQQQQQQEEEEEGDEAQVGAQHHQKQQLQEAEHRQLIAMLVHAGHAMVVQLIPFLPQLQPKQLVNLVVALNRLKLLLPAPAVARVMQALVEQVPRMSAQQAEHVLWHLCELAGQEVEGKLRGCVGQAGGPLVEGRGAARGGAAGARSEQQQAAGAVAATAEMPAAAAAAAEMLAVAATTSRAATSAAAATAEMPAAAAEMPAVLATTPQAATSAAAATAEMTVAAAADLAESAAVPGSEVSLPGGGASTAPGAGAAWSGASNVDISSATAAAAGADLHALDGRSSKGETAAAAKGVAAAAGEGPQESTAVASPGSLQAATAALAAAAAQVKRLPLARPLMRPVVRGVATATAGGVSGHGSSTDAAVAGGTPAAASSSSSSVHQRGQGAEGIVSKRSGHVIEQLAESGLMRKLVQRVGTAGNGGVGVKVGRVKVEQLVQVLLLVVKGKGVAEGVAELKQQLWQEKQEAWQMQQRMLQQRQQEQWGGERLGRGRAQHRGKQHQQQQHVRQQQQQMQMQGVQQNWAGGWLSNLRIGVDDVVQLLLLLHCPEDMINGDLLSGGKPSANRSSSSRVVHREGDRSSSSSSSSRERGSYPASSDSAPLAYGRGMQGVPQLSSQSMVSVFRAVAELELVRMWPGAAAWVQSFAAATCAQVAACEAGELGMLLESWYKLGKGVRGPAATRGVGWAAVGEVRGGGVGGVDMMPGAAAAARGVGWAEVGEDRRGGVGGISSMPGGAAQAAAARGEGGHLKLAAGRMGAAAMQERRTPAAMAVAAGLVTWEAVAPEAWWLAVAEAMCRSAEGCSTKQLGYLMRTAGRVMPRGRVKTLGGGLLNLKAVVLRGGLLRSLFGGRVLQEADLCSLAAIAWGAGRLGLWVPGHRKVGFCRAATQQLPGAAPAVLVQLLEAVWMLQLLQRPLAVATTSREGTRRPLIQSQRNKRQSHGSGGEAAATTAAATRMADDGARNSREAAQRPWILSHTRRRQSAGSGAQAAATKAAGAGVSSTANAAATVDAGRFLVQSIAQHCWEQLPFFKGSQLARLLVVLGRLGFRPRRELLKKVVVRLQGKLRFMTPKALAQVRRDRDWGFMVFWIR